MQIIGDRYTLCSTYSYGSTFVALLKAGQKSVAGMPVNEMKIEIYILFGKFYDSLALGT